MQVTYTNRKGRTYFLCKGTTKTGKVRYYFARELKGEPVEKIPEGYKISESVNGIVSLVKDRPRLILQDEIALIEGEIARHPKGRNYKTHAKHDRIIIYEMSGPDAEGLAGILERSGLLLLGYGGKNPGAPGTKQSIRCHYAIYPVRPRAACFPCAKVVLLGQH